MALVNTWHLRKVADSSARPCDVCYKATANVLITPDQRDHFYICQGHLKDHGFCSPIVDENEAAAKKKREEIDKQIEIIKKEYEEKMKERKEKEKMNNKKSDDKAKDKPVKTNTDDENEKAEKERDEKIRAISSHSAVPVADDMPRIYALQKVFYQKRIDRIRNAEIAKRNKERLKNPAFFPSVPKDNIG